MKNIIFVLFCLIPCVGFGQDKFEISGTLSNAVTGRTVLLEYKNGRGEDARDSTKIQDGTFVLNGNTAFGNKAILRLLPVARETKKRGIKPDELLFFLEKGRYRLTGNDSVFNAKIAGTPSQQEYLDYQRQLARPAAGYPCLFKRLSDAISVKDSVQMGKIRSELIALNARMSALRDSFIFSHPDSYVTLDLVVHEVNPVINPKYYAVLSKKLLSSVEGQKLTDRVEKAKLIALGKSIDITQPDDKGNLFKLSSLRGKYVLVDFWASWCGPCRSETPFLKRAYQKLKDKNFEIVSISLDATKAAWFKALKEDAMPWVQLSDLKGTKNDAAVRFGIKSIPQNVLVDPNGVIIGKNLRGEDVAEQLSVLIK